VCRVLDLDPMIAASSAIGAIEVLRNNLADNQRQRAEVTFGGQHVKRIRHRRLSCFREYSGSKSDVHPDVARPPRRRTQTAPVQRGRSPARHSFVVHQAPFLIATMATIVEAH
jgi:hypothetical protein